MPEYKTYEVMILSPEKVKIKIHCRCGNEIVEELPKFMDRISEMQVILRCPQCQQPYGRAMGKVARLSRETMLPEKMIDRGMSDSEVTSDEIESRLRREGKTMQPGSKAVN